MVFAELPVNSDYSEFPNQPQQLMQYMVEGLVQWYRRYNLKVEHFRDVKPRFIGELELQQKLRTNQLPAAHNPSFVYLLKDIVSYVGDQESLEALAERILKPSDELLVMTAIERLVDKIPRPKRYPTDDLVSELAAQLKPRLPQIISAGYADFMDQAATRQTKIVSALRTEMMGSIGQAASAFIDLVSAEDQTNFWTNHDVSLALITLPEVTGQNDELSWSLRVNPQDAASWWWQAEQLAQEDNLTLLDKYQKLMEVERLKPENTLRLTGEAASEFSQKLLDDPDLQPILEYLVISQCWEIMWERYQSLSWIFHHVANSNNERVQLEVQTMNLDVAVKGFELIKSATQEGRRLQLGTTMLFTADQVTSLRYRPLAVAFDDTQEIPKPRAQQHPLQERLEQPYATHTVEPLQLFEVSYDEQQRAVRFELPDRHHTVWVRVTENGIMEYAASSGTDSSQLQFYRQPTAFTAEMRYVADFFSKMAITAYQLDPIDFEQHHRAIDRRYRQVLKQSSLEKFFGVLNVSQFGSLFTTYLHLHNTVMYQFFVTDQPGKFKPLKNLEQLKVVDRSQN